MRWLREYSLHLWALAAYLWILTLFINAACRIDGEEVFFDPGTISDTMRTYFAKSRR